MQVRYFVPSADATVQCHLVGQRQTNPGNSSCLFSCKPVQQPRYGSTLFEDGVLSAH